MKKLTKKQAETLVELQGQLERKAGNLQIAVEEWNEWAEKAHEFVDEISSTMDEFIDNKSEKWLESEAGSVIVAWKDSWEEVNGLDWEIVSDMVTDVSMLYAEAVNNLTPEI